ncbi:MAG: hypothetical protein Q7S27_02660 [Nanoarchaeota archaeon]|nr:hypothetical protein [Nanoarchaeota archaeon]
MGQRVFVFGIQGILAGAFVAYLLRPSFMGMQLDLETIINGGSKVTEGNQFASQMLQTTYNCLMAGSIIGCTLGMFCGAIIHRKFDSNSIPPSPPNSTKIEKS